MHYSLRTEQNYMYWARWFIRWHRVRHSSEMGGKEVGAFLSMLANKRKATPSTHRQALSAPLLLYEDVLDFDLPWMQVMLSGVYLPFALVAKYPRAGQSRTWQCVFHLPTLSLDPRAGMKRRHFLFPERLQRALKVAVAQAVVAKQVSVPTLRHSFATHVLHTGHGHPDRSGVAWP